MSDSDMEEGPAGEKRWVVNEKLEAKERQNAARMNDGEVGGIRRREIKLTRTIYNLIRRLQRGRLVGWVHEAVVMIIL